MTTFAFIHGAGDVGWYWHLVEAELRARGYETVAPDLPAEDDSAGLERCAEVVIDAIGDRQDVVVVAQSFGGYVAPLVADRIKARLIVLLAAMVPKPGETADEMFRATNWEPAKLDDSSTIAVFYHDVPRPLAEEAVAHGRGQSDTPGLEPWPLTAWPEIETRAIVGRDDRFFPADWLRGVLRDRLGITPDELDSGHCPALSRPRELAELLDGYVGPTLTARSTRSATTPSGAQLLATSPFLPSEDSNRPKRDPAAGLVSHLAEIEADVGGVPPIEEPPAVGLAPLPHHLDGIGRALVGDARAPEVVERAEDVVVVVSREREKRELWVDDLAGRAAMEQPALEEVLVPSGTGRH